MNEHRAQSEKQGEKREAKQQQTNYRPITLRKNQLEGGDHGVDNCHNQDSFLCWFCLILPDRMGNSTIDAINFVLFV